MFHALDRGDKGLSHTKLKQPKNSKLNRYMFHALDRGDKGSITYSEFAGALQGPLVSKPGATALEMQVQN